ncbi:MAG: polysaccharide deacetylase family protein [Armatimonadota bacterium]
MACRKKSGCGQSIGLLFAVLALVAAAFVLVTQDHKPPKEVVLPPRRVEQPAPRPEPRPAPSAQKPAEKPASPQPSQPSEPGKEYSRGSAESREVALTFDAGASAAPTPEILETLARHGSHATFFLTGRWMEQNPKLARRIVAEGHEIGNHTFSHRRLTSLNAGEIADEVNRTEALALELTGKSTKPLVRVPYGARDARVLALLGDLGYTSIYWDLDSWDSVREGITSLEITDRVTGKIRSGSIVLLHCGSQASADALNGVLDQLESEGYRQVTVSELLGI